MYPQQPIYTYPYVRGGNDPRNPLLLPFLAGAALAFPLGYITSNTKNQQPYPMYVQQPPMMYQPYPMPYPQPPMPYQPQPMPYPQTYQANPLI